jgi:hypothetical protein
MFRRGAPQRRQSEGNNVANRLSARCCAKPTKEIPWPATLAWAARLRSRLLLKTTLPPPGRHRGSNQTSPDQYNEVLHVTQRGYRAGINGSSALLACDLCRSASPPARIWGDRNAGSIGRSAPASAIRKEVSAFRRKCDAANEILRRWHSGDSEIHSRSGPSFHGWKLSAQQNLTCSARDRRCTRHSLF